jgi:hypothetical protein
MEELPVMDVESMTDSEPESGCDTRAFGLLIRKQTAGPWFRVTSVGNTLVAKQRNVCHEVVVFAVFEKLKPWKYGKDACVGVILKIPIRELDNVRAGKHYSGDVLKVNNDGVPSFCPISFKLGSSSLVPRAATYLCWVPIGERTGEIFLRTSTKAKLFLTFSKTKCGKYQRKVIFSKKHKDRTVCLQQEVEIETPEWEREWEDEFKVVGAMQT